MSRPRRRKRKPVSRRDLAKLARKNELIAQIEEKLARIRRHRQTSAHASEAFAGPARSDGA